MKRSDGVPRRLGIYGGTFSPPHNGHIRAAKAFLHQANLDTLLVMPAAVSPHKQPAPQDDPSIRLELAYAAFEGLDDRIRVSDFEIRRGGASYTYQTLTHFSEITDDALYFLCGTDMFCTLEQWRHPEILFEKAVIACILRENDPRVYAEAVRKEALYRRQFGARTLMIHVEPMELSSTFIRQQVREGKSIEGLVPDAVARRISAFGLYKK